MYRQFFRIRRSQRISEFPLLLLPVLGIAAGVGAAEALYVPLQEIGATPLLTGTTAVLATLSLLAYRVRRPLTWAVLAFTLFFAIGGSRLLLDRSYYRCDWPAETPVTLRTEVVSVERQKAKTQLVTARITSGRYSERKIRATLMRKTDSAEIRPGDILLLHGEVLPPRNSGNPGSFDYARWLRRRDISGTIFCYNSQWQCVGTAPHFSLSTQLLRLRSKWTKHYADHFEGQSLEVLAAMTLGDRSLLTSDTRSVFTDSGSSHLLALSGLHLGILFGTLLTLLQLLPAARRRRWVPLLLIPFVWLFVAFTGASFSLMRSAIMFTFVLLTRAVRRDSASFDGILLAALLILVLWPQALFDVGFLLSFVSVSAILLVTPSIPRIIAGERKGALVVHSFRQRSVFALANFVVSLVCVSLAAQVATAPLVLGIFHTLPVYGLLASVLLIPLAYALLLCALVFIFFPPAAVILDVLLQALRSVLAFIAHLPGATLHGAPSAFTVVVAYAVLVLLWLTLRKRQKSYYYMSGIAIIVLAAAIVGDRRAHRICPQIIFYQTFGAPAVHCIHSASQSYVWTTRPEAADSSLSFIAGTFWKDYHIAPPVVLHADTLLPDLHLSAHTLTFHNRRIGLLHANLRTFPMNPLPVSHLFIAKGYTRSLPEALCGFSPDTLVLDGSLSDYTRHRLRREADSLRLPCHDIRRDGALVLY